MSPVTLETRRPTSAEAREIRALTRRSSAHDGYPALSERFLLALDPPDPDGADAAHLHVLARDGAQVVGYAQCQPGAGTDPASAELVVDPERRVGGIGSALLAALPADVRVWAHGASPATAGFAAARGLEAVRSLFVLGRELGPEPLNVVVPEGYSVRSFDAGRDEAELLRVNAAAFAHHPEQGTLDPAGLRARMALPWFRAAGLLLVVPAGDPGRVAAFHWTKIDPPGGLLGEVYVVGIDPAHQGRGLARPLTLLGLEHLRAAGCTQVVLYVDEENERAVRTYRALGFTDREVHRQFVRGQDRG